MTVKTLNPDDFMLHCKSLQRLVEESSFRPDTVVGIANGGVHVSKLVFPDVRHVSVSCRRPLSDTKDRSGATMSFIRSLPLWMRNLLRISESLIFGILKPARLKPSVNFDPAQFNDSKYILVVDDAVDSGVTLSAVLSALRQLPVAPAVKSAVITTTTPNPAVRPDFSIYSNRTLIRFPWSNDYRPAK